MVSGHIAEAGVARHQDKGVHGNRVHELTVNFQSAEKRGNGYLRVMQFHPDRIEVWTYSPTLDRYLRGEPHQFVVSRGS